MKFDRWWRHLIILCLEKKSPEKKESEEIRCLKNKIKALNNSISSLEAQNTDLLKKITNDEQNFKKKNIRNAKNNFPFILNQKIDQYKNEISDLKNKNLLIPHEIIEKNKFLMEMISYAMGNSPSSDFINFCNLIHVIDQKEYTILRDFIPLIPERTITSINSPEKSDIQNNLLNIENIPKALSNFYGNIEKDDKIHLTLGGDAASIKLIPETGMSASYTYMALPLDKNLKSFPVYI